MIKYREYKKFSNQYIRNPLNEKLPDNNELHAIIVLKKQF